MCYLECLRISSTLLPFPAGHEERPSLKIARSYWNVPSHNYKFSKYILRVPALLYPDPQASDSDGAAGPQLAADAAAGLRQPYREAEYLPRACVFLQIFIRSNWVVWERPAVTPECARGARPRAKRGEIALPQLYGFHWGWAVLVRANLMELSLLSLGWSSTDTLQ